MDKQKYVSVVSQGKNQSPVVNYERQHHIDCVTKFLIDYLLEDKLTIKIFGNQDLKRKKPVGNEAQINSRVATKPMFSGSSSNVQSNKSGSGLNSTMNTSVSSSSSGNYKIQG